MSPRRRRGGIIGFGFIAANGHLPAYAASDDLEIVAVADVCEARRRAAHEALPHAHIYEDYAALLAAEQREIDFIDITTPPYAHTPIACDALSKGLHVVCEKPLATTIEDARRMIQDAERHNRVLFPIDNYRYAPVIVAVRQVLDSGLIGRVHDISLSTFRNTHARGAKEWNEGWRRERRFAGGGIAMDHGSHTFYLAFEWLRSFPDAITAKTVARAPYDTEDTLMASLSFPTGLAAVHLTWSAGVRKVIYTIHGERGAIRVEDDDIEVAVIDESREGSTPGRTKWEMKTKKVASEWMDAGHAPWFRALFAQFALAMDRGDYVGRSANDALRCIEIITAAYESANDGCRERPILHVG